MFLLREGLRRGDEHRDLVGLRRERRLEALHVRRQHRIADAGLAADAAPSPSAASAICGTHFGETNAVASIAGKPASVSRSISATLTSVGHHRLLVLQAVARADFDQADARRQLRGDSRHARDALVVSNRARDRRCRSPAPRARAAGSWRRPARPNPSTQRHRGHVRRHRDPRMMPERMVRRQRLRRGTRRASRRRGGRRRAARGGRRRRRCRRARR